MLDKLGHKKQELWHDQMAAFAYENDDDEETLFSELSNLEEMTPEEIQNALQMLMLKMDEVGKELENEYIVAEYKKNGALAPFLFLRG